MDWELLKTWGIEQDTDPKQICDTLEERQLTLLQMRRSETDSAKKNEIADELKKLETQLKQAKKEARKKPESVPAASSSTISDTDASEADMKKKLEALKKQAEKKREEEKAKSDALTADNTSGAENKTTGSQPVKPNTQPQTVSPQLKSPMPQTTTDPTDRGAIPVGDSKQQLQSGITEFRNGNYNAAFSLFDDLAQKGNAEAEYYLFILFSKGLGTTADKDKANFWLKKSAEHRYAEAQFAYAMGLLSNRSGTDPLPKEGMQYLAKAADQDFQPALKQYIDIVLNGYNELPAIKSAIKYSSKMQSLLTDQYEVEDYRKKEEQLNGIQTNVKKSASSGKLLTAIGILSSVLLIVGFLYLLGGLHPDEWNKNALLGLLPDASVKLVIPFHLFWVLILPVVTVNGKFGLGIITLAYVCRSFYKAKQGIKIKGAFSAVSKLIVAAIIIWHLLLVIIEGQSFAEGIIYFVIAIIVCRVFGLIIGKIVNAISNSKSVVKGIIWTIVVIAILVAINKFTANVPALNSEVEHSSVNKAEADSNGTQAREAITAEIVEDDVTGYKNINVAAISADSVLVLSSGNHYEAKYMLDGDETTSWQEGVEGAGEGQTITADFDGNPQVDYIVIYNGNHRSEKSYANNNRKRIIASTFQK